MSLNILLYIPNFVPSMLSSTLFYANGNTQTHKGGGGGVTSVEKEDLSKKGYFYSKY